VYLVLRLGYGPDNRGFVVIFMQGKKFSSSSDHPKRTVAHSASYLVDTGGCYPGIKRRGLEADRPSASLTKLRMS